jgi:hypothetical protein
LANRLLRFRHNYVADATFVGWSFWHVSLVQIGGARKLKRGAFSVGTAAIRDAKREPAALGGQARHEWRRNSCIIATPPACAPEDRRAGRWPFEFRCG